MGESTESYLDMCPMLHDSFKEEVTDIQKKRNPRKQNYDRSNARNRVKIDVKGDGTIVTHKKSKSMVHSVHLPLPIGRKKIANRQGQNKRSMDAAIKAKNSMLVHKVVIIRGAVMGLLKQGSQEQDFFVQVICPLVICPPGTL